MRRMITVALLAMVLFAALLAFRRWAGFEGYDPYWIDYDRPGVDITSEGEMPWTLPEPYK